MKTAQRIISCISLSAIFLIPVAGCKKKEITDQLPRGTLVEVIDRGSLTKEEIIQRMNEVDDHSIVQNNVHCYAITYRTEYMGKPIDTRGLIIVPYGVDTAHLLMYTHGTTAPSALLGAENNSPSNYSGETDKNGDVRNMGLGWASAGYVVFIPDYIGYGITLGKDHPYMHLPEMFLSNIDGLLAAKKYITTHTSLTYDNRLFLTGWSQGGAASLSAHRYIQEQYPSEFTILGSSHLAGPHNFERFHDDIMSRAGEEVMILPIVSWAVYSGNKFSALKRPTDQMFEFPVYDQMSSLMIPSNDPEKVFKPHFRENVLNGNDTAYRAILKSNSNHKGWLPVGKVILHHGDNDEVVPYYNSTDALQGITEAGGNVVLYTYPGGGHSTELRNFIMNTLYEFNQLK